MRCCRIFSRPCGPRLLRPIRQKAKTRDGLNVDDNALRRARRLPSIQNIRNRNSVPDPPDGFPAQRFGFHALAEDEENSVIV